MTQQFYGRNNGFALQIIDDDVDMMLRLKILRTSDRSKPSSLGWAFKMCLVLFPKPRKHFYEMTDDGENRHPQETHPKAHVLKKAENRWRVIPDKEVRCWKGRVGLYIHIYAGKAHSSFYKCP